METFEAVSDGTLPDLDALARGISDLRLGATLRGVEATVEGWMVESGGEAVLRLSCTGELVRLVPLTTKVQWDRQTKGPQAATEMERSALARLRAAGAGRSVPVRVVGPVSRPRADERVALQVREYSIRCIDW